MLPSATATSTNATFSRRNDSRGTIRNAKTHPFAVGGRQAERHEQHGECARASHSSRLVGLVFPFYFLKSSLLRKRTNLSCESCPFRLGCGGPGLNGMGRLPAGSATGLCRRSGRHSNAHVTGEPAGCARPLRLLRALCKLVLHCVSGAPWGHALREGHVFDRQ